MLQHLSRATWNHWEGLVRALGNNSALARFARLTASNSSAAQTTAVDPLSLARRFECRTLAAFAKQLLYY